LFSIQLSSFQLFIVSKGNNSLCLVSIIYYNAKLKVAQYCVYIGVLNMDLYIYDSHTVPYDTVKPATPSYISTMQHVTFITYLFSTIFSTSTATSTKRNLPSTPVNTRVQSKKTSHRLYLPSISVRPGWYNEQDYWRRIVSRELSFHGITNPIHFPKSTDVTHKSNDEYFSTIVRNDVGQEPLSRYVDRILPPRCCPKRKTTLPSTVLFITTPDISFKENHVENHVENHEGIFSSTFEICILVLLILIVLFLFLFCLQLVNQHKCKRKIKFNSNDSCEMSSFRRRMQRHVNTSDRRTSMDLDVVSNLLRGNLQSQRFDDIPLGDITTIQNENCTVTFDVTADAHRADCKV
jgi:hypothetical protein